MKGSEGKYAQVFLSSSWFRLNARTLPRRLPLLRHLKESQENKEQLRSYNNVTLKVLLILEIINV